MAIQNDKLEKLTKRFSCGTACMTRKATKRKGIPGSVLLNVSLDWCLVDGENNKSVPKRLAKYGYTMDDLSAEQLARLQSMAGPRGLILDDAQTNEIEAK
jgi:hypothetical protein